MSRTALVIAGMCFVLSASAGEAEFSQKPVARRNGAKVRIEFALSSRTDVAVYVLDAGGKVVRHLAGGVLGKKPPAPLKPGLNQSLDWDGKDDKGCPAKGGPFKVRVAAGMKPEFDRFILHNPSPRISVNALAVGPKGNVHLFHLDPVANRNMGGTKLRVIDRNGKHVRVLMPFPADIAPDRVKSLGVFVTEEGDLVPRVHNYQQFCFYPDGSSQRGRSVPNVWSPTVDRQGRAHWLVCGSGMRLACVDAAGGVPYSTFLSPKLLGEVKGLNMANWSQHAWERPCLATSSDGKYLYLSGLTRGNNRQSVSCVYRVDLATRSRAEVFVGKLDMPGKEKALLTEPRGVAAAGGFLYVADAGADRIAVFKEADRSCAGEIKVEAPDTIGVDPASGAVYVVSGANVKQPDLFKFDGFKSGKEICRQPLPRYNHSKKISHVIAVDATAKPVRIWLPTPGPYPPFELLCVEDTGTKFELKGDPRSADPWAEGPRDMSVDRLNDELYVKVSRPHKLHSYYRVDEKTAKVKKLLWLGRAPEIRGGWAATQMVPGPDGSLYTWSFSNQFIRFDRDGKPIKLPGQDAYRLQTKLHTQMTFSNRGLFVKSPEELFVVPREATHAWSSLRVMGPDGQDKRTVIWQCLLGATPKLDAAGNIYLADMVKPPDRSYPEFFDGKLKPPPAACGVDTGAPFWTSYMYGSIVKFPPSGGAIWSVSPKREAEIVAKNRARATKKGWAFPKKPPADAAFLKKPKIKVKAHIGWKPHTPAELQGALWYRFGFSPYSGHTSGSTSCCMCEGAGFDVDPFGRVFFPNLGQFRIEVIDTNNNRITEFGKYGNEDSGPKGHVKKPAIPLAWPLAVAVGDKHAYVADTLGRRVVRVKLGYAVEGTCTVK